MYIVHIDTEGQSYKREQIQKARGAGRQIYRKIQKNRETE